MIREIVSINQDPLISLWKDAVEISDIDHTVSLSLFSTIIVITN